LQTFVTLLSTRLSQLKKSNGGPSPLSWNWADAVLFGVCGR
jgi:hypothetical protein